MASPDWRELLLSVDDVPSVLGKQPLSARLEGIANASSNYSGILSSGISAIGCAIAAAIKPRE